MFDNFGNLPEMSEWLAFNIFHNSGKSAKIANRKSEIFSTSTIPAQLTKLYPFDIFDKHVQHYGKLLTAHAHATQPRFLHEIS